MILVTGGTGFIGTHLLEKLVASGQAVRALVRRTGAKPRSLPAGVETVYGDLASGSGIVEALRGAGAVIHLAGVTKALRPEDYYTGNVRATEQLAHAMAGQGIRLVHVSSLAAIGPSAAGVPLTEDAEPHPLTHYGKSKLAAEKVVRDLAPYAVIVRPPVVYGPRDTDVFQLLKSISKGLVLEIAGGERWFSAIYVKDLVEGLLAAAGTPLAAGRTYFLAHAKPVSWRHLGASAARIMARTPRVVTVPFAAAHAVGACAEVWDRLRGKPGIISREKIAEARCMAWTCDTARAARELGFVAPTSLDEGLAATLAWYKEAGWLNVLKADPSKRDTRFWAVDKAILAYFACSIVLILGWWSKLPDALPLLAANVIGGAVIVYQVKRPNPTSWLFRNWYPLPYVASCYKEMALFIPAVRTTDADQWLADLDFRIWGAHPSVWLERVHSPVLTEFLQVVYTLFVPAVLYIAWILWRQRRTKDFQYYAFLIAMGFLASYIGYILVPARGPRFLLKHLQHFPLQGLWLFQTMQRALDRLESAHYDCFPSGHTELTILAWWGSRMVSKRLFRVYLAYTPCIIFATVYLRYHYTVDLLAGIVTAAVLILTAPRLYQKLSPKGL